MCILLRSYSTSWPWAHNSPIPWQLLSFSLASLLCQVSETPDLGTFTPPTFFCPVQAIGIFINELVITREAKSLHTKAGIREDRSLCYVPWDIPKLWLSRVNKLIIETQSPESMKEYSAKLQAAMVVLKDFVSHRRQRGIKGSKLQRRKMHIWFEMH